MSDDKKPIKVKFKDDFNSPTLELGHGEYSRKFDAKDQPFEITGYVRKEMDENDKETGEETLVLTAEEEKRLLLGSGYFVEVAEGEQQSEQQSVQGKAPKNLGKIGGAPTAAAADTQA